MKQVTSKENILKKIRTALIQKTNEPFPNTDLTSEVYSSANESLDVMFAEEFVKVQGDFIYCENVEEFINTLKEITEEREWSHLYCWEHILQELFVKHDFRKCRIGKSIEKADAGITLCEALIARTGSILLTSNQASGRTLSIYPPVHIVVAYSSQLVYDIKNGLDRVTKKYGKKLPSMITIASGPSRTADIEKTLVLGAHGPKEVIVFLIESTDK